jgi:thioredoxin-dependent peroxiredoxin
MLERKGIIQFRGKNVTVVGDDIFAGQQAPTFKAHLQDWSYIDILKLTRGKVRIIASVPSIDTDVCDRETRRFNKETGDLSKEVSVIVISTDLPFAQQRWCGAEGIDQVLMASDHLKAGFGKKYGCLLKEPRILRRAMFVVDRKYRVTYVDYMKSLHDEPDYESVLEAARKAL